MAALAGVQQVVPAAGATGGGPPYLRPGLAWYALFAIVFATFLNFFDASAFGLLIEQIRGEFHLSNIQLGWLTGPANIIFYLVVMLPLSRCADIFQRRLVLALGVMFIATFNAASGLALGFVSLFAIRMMVGAGGSAHAPGAYSLLADAFPPARRAVPFSVLQLGFILATSLGFLIAGRLFAWTMTFPAVQFGPVLLHGWRWMLLLLAIPGYLAALLLFAIREPARRGAEGEGVLPYTTVFAEVWSRRRVYGPLFASLAFATMHALATPAWVTPLFKRTYHWQEARIGLTMAPILLVGQVFGLIIGPLVVNWLAKRHKDANIRATAIFITCALPAGIAAPLMPNGYLALALLSFVGAMGIAGAPPQNLAIQLITPNRMRGQVTGLYLMMFTAFGSLGPLIVGIFIDKIFGSDGAVGPALALLACVTSPFACLLMWRAVKPYGEEVCRLEALGDAA